MRMWKKPPAGAHEYDDFEIVRPSELSDRGVTSYARKVLAAAQIA
jgi:hypothetical protein